jgi:hypothetical protein
MKLFKPGFAFLSALCIVLSVQGATLFSDNFSDTSNTEKAKWHGFANLLTKSFSIGALTIQNPDTMYTDFITYIIPSSPKPSTYTYSATIKVTDGSSGMGLVHCFKSSPLQYYSCQFAPGKNVYAYVGSTVLANQDAGFGSSTSYEITVSKTGSTCNIFCNGHYVTTYNDATYSSGDIGFCVPPKSTIQVTKVLLTDQFIPGSPITFFADTFNTAGLKDGWNTATMSGTLTSGSGSCVLNNTSTTASSIVYVRGDFSTGSLKGVVSQVRGAGLYGVTLMSILTSGTSITYKNFAFTVDSLQNYAVIYPDSTSIRAQPGAGVLGSYGTDTIEVRKFATRYELWVNGAPTDLAIPIPTTYRIDAVGLYVGANTSARFNLFVAGGDSLGARVAVLNPALHNVQYSPLPTFGNGSIVYDIMGRKIGSFTKVGFDKANIITGPYIVWTPGMNGAKGYTTRVMKIRTK